MIVTAETEKDINMTTGVHRQFVQFCENEKKKRESKGAPATTDPGDKVLPPGRDLHPPRLLFQDDPEILSSASSGGVWFG